MMKEIETAVDPETSLEQLGCGVARGRSFSRGGHFQKGPNSLAIGGLFGRVIVCLDADNGTGWVA